MGYSIDPITADCYEGTTCLINKFGITDEDRFSQIEGQITFVKGSELEHHPIQGDFDFAHCTTNILHPFREGNGRTQRIFLSQLIRFAGYDIHFSTIDTDELMTATIHAANGVDVYLKQLFTEAITNA